MTPQEKAEHEWEVWQDKIWGKFCAPGEDGEPPVRLIADKVVPGYRFGLQVLIKEFEQVRPADGTNAAVWARRSLIMQGMFTKDYDQNAAAEAVERLTADPSDAGARDVLQRATDTYEFLVMSPRSTPANEIVVRGHTIVRPEDPTDHAAEDDSVDAYEGFAKSLMREYREADGYMPGDDGSLQSVG